LGFGARVVNNIKKKIGQSLSSKMKMVGHKIGVLRRMDSMNEKGDPYLIDRLRLLILELLKHVDQKKLSCVFLLFMLKLISKNI